MFGNLYSGKDRERFSGDGKLGESVNEYVIWGETRDAKKGESLNDTDWMSDYGRGERH